MIDEQNIGSEQLPMWPVYWDFFSHLLACFTSLPWHQSGWMSVYTHVWNDYWDRRAQTESNLSRQLSPGLLGLRSSRTFWSASAKQEDRSRHASLQLIHTHFCLALKDGGDTEEVSGGAASVSLLVRAGHMHAVTHRSLGLGRLRLLHSGFAGIQVQAQVLQQAALFLHRETDSASAEAGATSCWNLIELKPGQVRSVSLSGRSQITSSELSVQISIWTKNHVSSEWRRCSVFWLVCALSK